MWNECSRCGAAVAASELSGGMCVRCLLEPGLDPPAATETGDSFGSYRIVCEIGEGGMGIVYLAEQTDSIRREVALKVLKPGLDTREIIARFDTERQALALMAHPNIARVYDSGSSTRGRPFFVMEFVDGLPVTEYCDRAAYTVARRVQLFATICRAVDHAHRQGIIHRDLKPSNLLIAETDGSPVPKIIDFGIAKALGRHLTGQTVETAFGQMLGTPEYMSPEQADLQEGAITAATDIYSLGVVLYELAAGLLPFDSERLRTAGLAGMNRILREENIPGPATRLRESSRSVEIARLRNTDPRTLQRLLSRDLANIIGKALRKHPPERYRSAAALADDLELWIDGRPVLAARPTLSYRAGKLLRRHRRPLAATALALVAVIAALFWIARRPPILQKDYAVTQLTSFEGTEVSPSFSPDGNQIAFAWDGEQEDNYDIYTLRLGDFKPRRLTSSPAAEFSPAWSPDGKWIAYLRNETGKPPDLMLIPPQGGEPRLLATTMKGVDLNDTSIAWTPDSRWLVVSDKAVPGQPDQIFAYSLETGLRHALTSRPPPDQNHLRPDVSPDGHTLAFCQGNIDIKLLPLGPGMQPAGPERAVPIAGVENRFAGYARWISNRELLFNGSLNTGRQFFRAPAGGGTPERLGQLGEGITTPAFSPDRRRLAFARSLHDPNLWRLDLDSPGGKEVRRRAIVSSTQWDQNGVFSPDGTRIAFETTRTRSSEIWIASSDGLDPVPITADTKLTGSPRWSPDGKYLAVDSTRDGRGQIYVIDLATKEARRVTNGPRDDLLPAWSPDAKWLYFCSLRSGAHQIWRTPAEGGPVTRITQQGGFDGMLSADGKWLYYAKVRGPVTPIWRVPAEGGEETQVVDGVRPRCFTVTRRGLYFGAGLPFSARKTELRFLNFASGKIKTLATFDRVVSFRLSVSPDDRSILYTQLDQNGYDLMLVDNFR